MARAYATIRVNGGAVASEHHESIDGRFGERDGEAGPLAHLEVAESERRGGHRQGEGSVETASNQNGQKITDLGHRAQLVSGELEPELGLVWRR